MASKATKRGSHDKATARRVTRDLAPNKGASSIRGGKYDIKGQRSGGEC